MDQRAHAPVGPFWVKDVACAETLMGSRLNVPTRNPLPHLSFSEVDFIELQKRPSLGAVTPHSRGKGVSILLLCLRIGRGDLNGRMAHPLLKERQWHVTLHGDDAKTMP